MYIVIKNAIRDNERVKTQSHYGGPMDTTTMIVEDTPVYSYNSAPVEDSFWNRLQKGIKYIFHDSASQPIPSSSFNTLIMLSEQRIVTLSIIDMGQLVRPIHIPQIIIIMQLVQLMLMHTPTAIAPHILLLRNGFMD